MANPNHSDLVTFTTKGQVVIPARLRKQFEIEPGTRAFVVSTEQGILLKPVTAAAIRRGFGVLKPKGKSDFREMWRKHKAEEHALEDKE